MFIQPFFKPTFGISMKRIFISILFVLLTQNIHAADWQKRAQYTGATIVAAGSVYLLSKGYSSYLVSSAQARFQTERTLLNQYASYSHLWSAELDQQLKNYLKAEIVRLHNKNRNKWAITVLYEYSQGKSAYCIDHCYAKFPFLQHKKDLDWYLKRLKAIRFLSLYSDLDELNLLIDQLTYIKEFIVSDHDYNVEEQLFDKRG